MFKGVQWGDMNNKSGKGTSVVPLALPTQISINQYPHQPAKLSRQGQLLRVHMKQPDLTRWGRRSLFNHTKLIFTR